MDLDCRTVWINADQASSMPACRSEHLPEYADILDTIGVSHMKERANSIKENRLNIGLGGWDLAPRPGLEPGTCGLTVFDYKYN